MTTKTFSGPPNELKKFIYEIEDEMDTSLRFQDGFTFAQVLFSHEDCPTLVDFVMMRFLKNHQLNCLDADDPDMPNQRRAPGLVLNFSHDIQPLDPNQQTAVWDKLCAIQKELVFKILDHFVDSCCSSLEKHLQFLVGKMLNGTQFPFELEEDPSNKIATLKEDTIQQIRDFFTLWKDMEQLSWKDWTDTEFFDFVLAKPKSRFEKKPGGSSKLWYTGCEYSDGACLIYKATNKEVVAPRLHDYVLAATYTMEILLRDGPSKMSPDFKPFTRADDFLTEFSEHFCLNGHDGPTLHAFLTRGGFKIITLRYADQIAHKLENGQASRQDDSPIKDVSPVKEVYKKQAREYRARYEELQQSTTKEKQSMMSLLTEKEESQRNLVNNLGDVFQKEGAANRGLVQDLAKKQGDQVASVMKAQGEHLKMQGEQFSAALKTQGEQHASVVDKFSGMHLESQVTVRAAIAALGTGQGVPAPSVQATATMSTGNEETAPAPAPFVQATAPSVQSTTATVSTDDETGADTVWMPVNEMTNAQLAEELVDIHGFPADVNKLKKTNKYILVSMVEDKRKQHKN